MTENNQMIQKPKMGFMQKIRKAMLMRNIDEVKYLKAPDELKVDMDVVIALLSKSPNSASILTHHLKMQAIEQDENIFANLPGREQLKIAELEPQYVTKLREDRALAYIHKYGMVYAKYLPEPLQEKMLTEQVKLDNTIISFNPELAQRVMDQFSPSVVEKVVSEAAQNAKAEDATDRDKQLYEDMYNNAPVGWMPLEMQRKLVEIDSKFIDKTSEEAFTVLIQENPELIKDASYHLSQVSMLPVDVQLHLASIDSKVVSELSEQALQQYVANNPEALKQLDSDTQIQLVAKHSEYEAILDDEQKRKLEEINQEQEVDLQLVEELPVTSIKDAEDFEI